MRNMSFYHTRPQIEAQTKTVTRRKGWKRLRVGDRFWAIEKGQGLKKGQQVRKLCLLECVSVRDERLDAILNYPADETAKEGFPQLTAQQFVDMFCQTMNAAPGSMLRRIAFRYVSDAELAAEAKQNKQGLRRAGSTRRRGGSLRSPLVTAR